MFGLCYLWDKLYQTEGVYRISLFLKFRNRVTGNLKPLRPVSQQAAASMFTSHVGRPWGVRKP